VLIHIVADYGHGDLTFAEVVQRLKCFLPDAEPMLTTVPPFSTLAAGFCIGQLGLNEAPAGTSIYHNVAPRLDDPEARVSNAGERLAFAPGSSGWRHPQGGETRWMELFLRGGSAWEAFQRPGIGEPIQILSQAGDH
jgi:hypothetical protein